MHGRLLPTDANPKDHTVPVVSQPGENTAFITLALRHALPGGKGGFGANLKGSAAASRPSSNFDACRDLHGRRVRTVRAERALNRLSHEPLQPAASSVPEAAGSSSVGAPTSSHRKRHRPDDSSSSHLQARTKNSNTTFSANSLSEDADSGHDNAADLVADKMETVSHGVVDAVLSAVQDSEETVGTTCAPDLSPNKRRRVGSSHWALDSASMILDGYSSSSSSSSSNDEICL